MKRILAALCGAVGLCLGASATEANTIQSIFLNSTTSGPNTVYTYQLEITANNGLQGGSIDPSALVILDFPGFVSADISSTGGDLTSTGDWSLSTASTGAGSLPDSSTTAGIFNLGGFSGGINANDGPGTNVVLQYVGAGLPIGGGSFNSLLLHLNITSSLNSFSPVQSVSRNTAIGGISNETDSFPILAQGGGGVPEPASLSLLAVGVSALMVRRRK